MSMTFKEVPRRSENTWGNKSMLVAAVSCTLQGSNHSNSQPDGGLASHASDVTQAFSDAALHSYLCLAGLWARIWLLLPPTPPVSMETLASCRLMLVYMLNYCISKTGASTIYTVFDLGNKLMNLMRKLSLPAFFFTSSSVLFPVAASAFMGSAAVDSRTVQEIVWTVTCVCVVHRVCVR